MTKVVVTEKALREMVQEAMWNKEFSGWSANHDEPAQVNASTDPSIAVTDPVNPNFTPQNKTEFGVAVNQLVRNLPDSEMSKLFDTVKTAIDQNEKKEDQEDMKTKAAQGGTDQVEESVRKSIRKILGDINPRWRKSLAEARPDPWKNAPAVTGPLPPVKKIPFGVHGGEAQRRIDKNKADLQRGLGKAVDAYENPVIEPEEETPIEAPEGEGPAVNPQDPAVGDGVPDAPAKRRAYKTTALGSMSDIDYDEEEGEHKPASFEEIATELGFSVAGAKQAVDKALEKTRFLNNDMDDDDREILVLTAMNDYIKYLVKSGELEAPDVQLMKDHPEIVRELDGFREFLHNHFRRARKADQRLINPVKDDVTDVGSDVQQAVGESRKRPVLYLRPRSER